MNIVRPTTMTFALVGIVVLYAMGEVRLAPIATVWVARPSPECLRTRGRPRRTERRSQQTRRA